MRIFIAYLLSMIVGLHCLGGETNHTEDATVSSNVVITGKSSVGKGQYQAYSETGYRRIFLDVFEKGEPSDHQEEVILPQTLGIPSETNRLIVVTGERRSAKVKVKGNSGQTYWKSEVYASSWKYVDKKDAPLVERVGFLPKIENQHPLVVKATVGEGHQAYLDLVENGERKEQIIVVYPINMAQPQEHNRLVEIKGKLHIFKGSKPKTTPYKQAFDCEVIEVLEWKYKD
jgi:hypothetical protein